MRVLSVGRCAGLPACGLLSAVLLLLGFALPPKCVGSTQCPRGYTRCIRQGRGRVSRLIALRAEKREVPEHMRLPGSDSQPRYRPEEDLEMGLEYQEDPPEKTPELEEFLGPIPDLKEPALEKSWDGWSKDDLQEVVDAQNRILDVEYARSQKLKEFDKPDPREEVLQKKYREIFREAAAYGVTDDVFNHLYRESPLVREAIQFDMWNNYTVMRYMKVDPSDISRRKLQLEELKKDVNVEDFINIRLGEDGGYIIDMQRPEGDSLTVHSHGANIQSWTPAGGSEMLWTDPDHVFSMDNPIPGGISISFPVHDDSNMMMDFGGFLRDIDWSVGAGVLWGEGTPQWTRTDKSCPTVYFFAEPDDESKLRWGYDFKVLYVITLMHRRLRTEVRIVNTDQTEGLPFEFTGGLRAHFKVDEGQIGNTRVVGLSRKNYFDYLTPTEHKSSTRRIDRNRTILFSPTEPIRRVYPFPNREIRLHRGIEGSGVAIRNARDPVMLGWIEYGVEKPAGDPGYVVLESAQHIHPHQLIPGQQFFGRTHFEADVNWENPVEKCAYTNMVEGQKGG
ncbi:hypothetical protein AAMO2058_000418800 [Amorphochlora amoebiformis]